MGGGAIRVLVGVMLTGIVGCGQGGVVPHAQSAPDAAPRPVRSITALVRVEPNTIATKSPRMGTDVARYLVERMFNAKIALIDGSAHPSPYLVEALPQLDTESWRVFPDGTMQTTYRLRPNLTWHDGTPLSAEDFVFGWQVYAHPGLGLSGTDSIAAIEEVSAPDTRTFVIRWRRPYPNAASLSQTNSELVPFPRHILEALFKAQELDALVNHNYWSREYVGLGPYRLDTWQPGAYIEASAFDGHALGRPKIDRIKVIFSPDANAALATILSGVPQLTADVSLSTDQALILRNEWQPVGIGSVLGHPNQWRAAHLQFRPELVSPASLADVRVRKALAYAVDREALNAGVHGSLFQIADSMVPSTSVFGPAADRAVVRYPFDLRRSEQLMAEAGFRRGSDGTYRSAEGRFATEVKTNASPENEGEMSIMAAAWRQAGFDVQDTVLPTGQIQSTEARSSFPGLFVNSRGNGEPSVLSRRSADIPNASNRWVGSNHGGWSNADYDRLIDAWSTTLDPATRERQLADALRIFTDDVSAINLFFPVQFWASVAGVRGLQEVAPEANLAWNIHEWDWSP